MKLLLLITLIFSNQRGPINVEQGADKIIIENSYFSAVWDSGSHHPDKEMSMIRIDANTNADVEIRNCVFENIVNNNSSRIYAVLHYGKNLLVKDCIFKNLIATVYDKRWSSTAMYIRGTGDAQVISCDFINASGYGAINIKNGNVADSIHNYVLVDSCHFENTGDYDRDIFAIGKKGRAYGIHQLKGGSTESIIVKNSTFLNIEFSGIYDKQVGAKHIGVYNNRFYNGDFLCFIDKYGAESVSFENNIVSNVRIAFISLGQIHYMSYKNNTVVRGRKWYFQDMPSVFLH